MKLLPSPQALAGLLRVDAVVSGGTAVLLVAGAGLLAAPLGLPEPFLRAVGLVLLPFVGFVAWSARREMPHAAAVWTVVAANLLWVGGSVILLIGPWLEPTALGMAFIVGQALVVAGFADLQAIAQWRRSAAQPYTA